MASRISKTHKISHIEAENKITHVQCDGLVSKVSDYSLKMHKSFMKDSKIQSKIFSHIKLPAHTFSVIAKYYISFKAVMKMVKHCHEESQSNMEVAQGALLGLAEGNRLEITNCFPFPKSSDESVDEEEYQLAMMRRLRRVNVDHFHVGWYQSADVGNFLSLPLLESQFHYQTSIEESVVVIYDTQKSARGFLTLKAYRLTPQAIAMYREGEFTPDALRNLKIGYEKLFVEVPIHIKNSQLTNIMMSELSELVPEEEGTHFLDLGTASVLENHIRCMMDRVDELYQEASKFNKYQQMVMRQEQVLLHNYLNQLFCNPYYFRKNIV